MEDGKIKEEKILKRQAFYSLVEGYENDLFYVKILESLHLENGKNTNKNMTTPGTTETLDLAALKAKVVAVAALGLKSKAASLRLVFSEIDTLMETGYSLTSIMETVSDGGIAFDSLPSFKTTLYRIRDSDGGAPNKKSP